MKKYFGILIFTVLLGMFFPKESFSLALYDDFQGMRINTKKWREAEVVREIDITNQRFISELATPSPSSVTSYPYSSSNWLPFPNGNSVNSIRANVTILESTISGSAQTRARIGGRWYNDGSAGGGMTGDMWAEVALLQTPSGFYAHYGVSKFTNADGSTVVDIFWKAFPTPISPGTSYTLFISYDSTANQFTFRIGAEEHTIGVGQGIPPRVGNPNSPFKGIGTRVQMNNSTSSGFISAAFDDVYKNDALYDDFSSMSGIESAKWTSFEIARDVSTPGIPAGAQGLRIGIRNSGTSTAVVNNNLNMVVPSSTNTIQAKVTLLGYNNPNSIYQRACIQGTFYNDGTGGPGLGRIGDVAGMVRIGGRNPIAAVEWGVYRIMDAAGNTSEALAEGTLIDSFPESSTCTLYLNWNGSEFTFRYTDASGLIIQEATYGPTTTINPVSVPFRLLSGRIAPEAGKTEGSIAALFDDVKVDEQITGRVTRDSDGQGIQVLVSVFNSNRNLLLSSLTDASGNYTAGGFAAGNYYLGTFNSMGYMDEWYNNVRIIGASGWPPAGATPVNVVLGSTTNNVDFGLSAGGTILGQVTAVAGGAGIGNVGINVYSNNWDLLKSGQTDPSGNYTMGGFPTGSYYVGTNNTLGYADEVFNNIPVLTGPWPPVGAAAVNVTEAANTPNINFALDMGGSLSGQVRGQPGGVGIQGVEVRVFNSGWRQIRSVWTDPAGNYTVNGLPAGSYYLRTSNGPGYIDEYYNNVVVIGAPFPPVGVAAVNVTGGTNTPNIDFDLAVAGTFSGRVTKVSDGSGIQGVQVRVFNNSWVQVRSPTTDASGNYTVGGLPTGSYFVGTWNNLGYIDEYYDNVQVIGSPWPPVGATPVNVTQGASVPNINITLNTGGSISGQVTVDPGGAGIQNVWVEVLDNNWNFLTNAQTNASGNYTVVGLPTGSYYLDTWNELTYVDECYDNIPIIGSPWPPPGATAVNVTQGANVPNINFALVLGGRIAGRVTNASGNGVADVDISLHDLNSNWMAGGPPTDSNGYYSLSAPAGNWKVFFNPWRAESYYVSEWYNNKSYPNEANSVPVVAGQTTTNINAQLETGGRIAGRVTNASGIGIPTVGIGVSDPNGNFMWGTGTDSNGNYALNVPAGDWKLCFNPGDYYLPECYDNKANLNEANLVAVVAGQTTSNINAQLETGGKISGRVTNASGNGIPNVNLAANDANGIWGGGSSTDSNGNYSFNVPAGNWKIFFDASRTDGYYASEWYDNKSNFNGANVVAVVAGQTTPNINAQLDAAGRISGRVTNASGNGIPNVDLAANDANGIWGGGSSTDSNGNYWFNVAAGSWKVFFNAWRAGGYYLSEWYDNKANSNDANSVPVTAGQTTSNIDAQLETGGKISGRVTNASGNGIPNLGVNIFDVSNPWVSGTGTDSNGNYSANLPPGTYKVYFGAWNAGNYYPEWYDNRATIESADQVVVTLGQTTSNINAQLTEKIQRTIGQAIADGIAWLAGKQNADGSWGGGGNGFDVFKTALAVLILESYAPRLGVDPLDPAYIYRTQVEQGLNFLLGHGYVSNISNQIHGNPDTNGNGIGIYFISPGANRRPIYETSMVMAAFASTRTPERIISHPNASVNGRTYLSLVQDMIDFMAWAQTDSGNGRGGWNYEEMDNSGDRSDQSNSGWVTLGLAYAEAPLPEGFGLQVPGFVRTELDIWIDYIQNDVEGGSGYDSPNNMVNILKTGNLLQQMAFVGDTASTPRAQAAINYIVRHWYDNNPDPGWRGNPSAYQATYTTMKGLEAHGIDLIDSIDWFSDFTTALLSEQFFDGSFPVCMYDDGQQILSSEWALLTLLRAIPPTLEKPDLVIEGAHGEWVNRNAGTYVIHFTVKNRGNVIAPAGADVGLTVEGTPVEQKLMPQLIPGASYSDTFASILTFGGVDQEEIGVCADVYSEVDELNEGNNCSTIGWPEAILPGDCNGDGQTSINEVQMGIIQFLGVSAVRPCCDLNGNGQVTIDELQRVINAFLGITQ